MHLYSPTQITLFRDCERAWAFRYLSGIKQPQGFAAALGTEIDDTQLQPYLRDDRPIDFSRPSGYIAAAGLSLLPAPKTHDLGVQVHVIIPCGSFGIQGYIDLWLPRGGMPDSKAPLVPTVSDFKSTGNWKYALTSEQLKTNVQAMTYAHWAAAVSQSPVIDLDWIYLATKGPRKAKRVHLRVTREHVAGEFSKILETAREIDLIRLANPDPLELRPNPKHCEKYPGMPCPHQATCNLSPAETADARISRYREKDSHMSNSPSGTMSLLERMKAKQAGALGVSQETPPIAPPAAAPVDTSGPIVPYYLKGGIPASNVPSHVVGINPPEAALPPAPPVGSVAPPPAVSTAPATETVEKPTRGRPRKEKVDIEVNVDGAHLEGFETVTVTWGKETSAPIAYNSFDVGPFEVTGFVRKGETVFDAQARIYVELERFAEAVREAKAISNQKFLAAIGGSR